MFNYLINRPIRVAAIIMTLLYLTGTAIYFIIIFLTGEYYDLVFSLPNLLAGILIYALSIILFYVLLQLLRLFIKNREDTPASIYSKTGTIKGVSIFFLIVNSLMIFTGNDAVRILCLSVAFAYTIILILLFLDKKAASYIWLPIILFGLLNFPIGIVAIISAVKLRKTVKMYNLLKYSLIRSGRNAYLV